MTGGGRVTELLSHPQIGLTLESVGQWPEVEVATLIGEIRHTWLYVNTDHWSS